VGHDAKTFWGAIQTFSVAWKILSAATVVIYSHKPWVVSHKRCSVSPIGQHRNCPRLYPGITTKMSYTKNYYRLLYAVNMVCLVLGFYMYITIILILLTCFSIKKSLRWMWYCHLHNFLVPRCHCTMKWNSIIWSLCQADYTASVWTKTEFTSQLLVVTPNF
jgi:hypothetical protein